MMVRIPLKHPIPEDETDLIGDAILIVTDKNLKQLCIYEIQTFDTVPQNETLDYIKNLENGGSRFFVGVKNMYHLKASLDTGIGGSK